jgi:hypothetical protein
VDLGLEATAQRHQLGPVAHRLAPARSLLRALLVPSSRARAASSAGTSTTGSPAATSSWAMGRPRPLALPPPSAAAARRPPRPAAAGPAWRDQLAGMDRGRPGRTRPAPATIPKRQMRPQDAWSDCGLSDQSAQTSYLTQRWWLFDRLVFCRAAGAFQESIGTHGVPGPAATDRRPIHARMNQARKAGCGRNLRPSRSGPDSVPGEVC